MTSTPPFATPLLTALIFALLAAFAPAAFGQRLAGLKDDLRGNEYPPGVRERADDDKADGDNDGTKGRTKSAATSGDGGGFELEIELAPIEVDLSAFTAPLFGTALMPAGSYRPIGFFLEAPFEKGAFVSESAPRDSTVLFRFEAGARAQDGSLFGFRLGAQALTIWHVGAAVVYQHLFEVTPDGRLDSLRLYHFMWGWQFFPEPTAIFDIGIAISGLGADANVAKDVFGFGGYMSFTVLFDARAIFYCRAIATKFRDSFLIDFEISAGYLVGLFEFRLGAWLIGSKNTDPLLGPLLAVGVWL